MWREGEGKEDRSRGGWTVGKGIDREMTVGQGDAKLGFVEATC